MSLELKDSPLDPKAWDRFQEIGLPSKGNELYRYVRLRDLYRAPFNLPTMFSADFEPQESTLVFVNGAYSSALSSLPKPAIALPLSQAFATYGSFLSARIAKLAKEEKDPFAALNGAYCKEGLFIYLPPKCVCTAPIKVINIVTELDTPTLICPRIHFFAAKQSEALLIWEQKGFSEHVWTNAFIDCALEESASVTLTALHLPHENSHHFWALRSTLKANSRFTSYSVACGSATSREDYVVRLQGEGAEASLFGVWNLKASKQHHVNVWMDHAEPSCTSLQKFKGTVQDTSRSSFEGKIYVHQKAQKTQAFQMNNNLILGEGATANSKPNLEIFADDVKASHGSTIGQINADHLFYLTARGIPLHVARALLVEGFTREVIDLIPDHTLRKRALSVLL